MTLIAMVLVMLMVMIMILIVVVTLMKTVMHSDEGPPNLRLKQFRSHQLLCNSW